MDEKQSGANALSATVSTRIRSPFVISSSFTHRPCSDPAPCQHVDHQHKLSPLAEGAKQATSQLAGVVQVTVSFGMLRDDELSS